MPISKLSNVKFGIKLPFLSIDTNWEVSEPEKSASWELYVELITRISVQQLNENEGSLREALNSLYSIFGTTRSILKNYGPVIATPAEASDLTFGHLAVRVLNEVLRPFMSKWHSLLMDHESTRPAGLSIIEHEHKWKYYDPMRNDLNNLRKDLTEYAEVLGEVAGVGKLI